MSFGQANLTRMVERATLVLAGSVVETKRKHSFLPSADLVFSFDLIARHAQRRAPALAFALSSSTFAMERRRR